MRDYLSDEQEAAAPNLKRCDELLSTIEAIHQARNLLTDGISLQEDLEDPLGLDNIPDVHSQLKELIFGFREFKKKHRTFQTHSSNCGPQK